MSFRRLAIVNRGEPAMRAIHAVRELNISRLEPIRLIALYTEPERNASWVLHADESYSLGSPTFVDSGDGGRKGRYLDYAALERALRETGADAAWVGWGFVAEHPAFVELCDRLGVTFVGPSASTMRRIGDKIEAKRLAEKVGVPVAPWSGGPVESQEEARHQAAEIGFPVMIKATAGGGGRGIRRVDDESQLDTAFEHARAEARAGFGDPTVLMERLVAPARHVEVQVIADSHGNAWAVGVRDCSLQRRNQKVMEESSSPALSPDQDRELREAAVRLAVETGYLGAGTVEFLYEPANKFLSFLEVNARLQVEHPVTEMVTGLDIVKLQIHVAEGGRLEGEPPAPSGHAVEARLNAEDAGLDFAPAPGRVELLRLPTGPGLRVDTGVVEGDVIPAEFDSMIAKLIAWGRDRDEALARLRRALAETVTVLDDGTTNHGFLLDLLDDPDVQAGRYDTGWLDRRRVGLRAEPVQNADAALIQAAIELYDDGIAADRARFFAFARRGRPEADLEPGSTIELRYRDCDYRFRVGQTGPGRYEVEADGRTLEVHVEALDPYERRLAFAGRFHKTVTARQGAQLRIEVDGVPHRISREERGIVRATGPGVVVSIPVQPGDEVQSGDVVAIVESMKMESSLTSPFHGRVTEVLSGANVQVASQAPLLRIAPLEGGAQQGSTEQVTFPANPVDGVVELAETCAAGVRRLQQLVLGYDIGEDEAARIGDRLRAACSNLPGCDCRLVPEEHRLLGLFADLRVLTQPRHDPGDPEAELVRAPQEHLHSYLRSLDPDAEPLPATFLEQLRRALGHYGIEDLERTPQLEEACHRLFLSQHRAAAVQPAVVAILERRLDGTEIDPDDEELRELIDRLVAATEHRDPVVADLARAVRYRYFDEPVIEAARERVYAEMEEHLSALTEDPARSDRNERLRALVACPQPLAPLLTRRIGDADPALGNVLVQAMTGRYHRQHPLSDMHFTEIDGRDFLIAKRLDDNTQVLAVTFGELGELSAAARALRTLAADLREDEGLIADFYAEHRGELPARDELVATIASKLAAAGTPAELRQLVVAIAEPGRGRGMSAVDLFTFTHDGAGMVEDRSLRGLHPGMAERLRLWRLREFELERLPSAEDVYLFRGVARKNPKDERLFALAEVRDFTQVHDSAGELVAVPELERMLLESLEAMRTHLAHLPPRKRPLWNRVMLHTWPVIEPTPEQLRTIIERHAPATNGLGVEMVLLHGRVHEPADGWRERLLRFFKPAGSSVLVEEDDPPVQPVQPLDEGALRVIAARRRGTLHPAEIVKLLGGEFVEHDFDEQGRLAPVERPPATNEAGIVVGLTRAFSERYPEGMLRVALLGDPTRALGSLAEPECVRILAALDLAESLGVPLEWFALSAGAKIAMDSGTENMDWIAAVLRRIVEFTQRGNELNVVVTGINVGAQPYWNAEATMLMHTKGMLVMTPESAMVLTGKQSLDYSGGVSAEDNVGIGGYERIMGPNGQAQYWAPDVASACRLLLSYYEHTYVAPGERFPRRAETSDPFDRDAGAEPHSAPDSDLTRIGEIFSDATNPERKKPFDIRSLMRATVDKDHPPLERWAGMADAEVGVVWDAHLGGWPVTVLGFESRPLPRQGALPADGPDLWTSGTLFPRSSKKIARALNAASGRRPVVVLANLAGFDGSPESMRSWQLEFGAEIGRAIVNFDGPIVFCVVSRYHGGAFVVFSQKLNEDLETVALEGAHASVIGGAPAAGVVFAREVDLRTRKDERVAALDRRIAEAEEAERGRLVAERATLWQQVRSEKLGEMAAEFDSVHSVERAVEMGSVSKIIPATSLRPYLVEAVDRGIERTLAHGGRADGRHRLAAQRGV